MDRALKALLNNVKEFETNANKEWLMNKTQEMINKATYTKRKKK